MMYFDLGSRPKEVEEAANLKFKGLFLIEREVLMACILCFVKFLICQFFNSEFIHKEAILISTFNILRGKQECLYNIAFSPEYPKSFILK